MHVCRPTVMRVLLLNGERRVGARVGGRATGTAAYAAAVGRRVG